MVRTRVGYAGGTTKAPTYRQIGDHTEVFQVDYDTSKTSFDALLKVFWSEHNPCSKAWSTQYAAILFYDGADQKKAAEASMQRVAKALGREIETALRPIGTFTRAEDYHQKYTLRRYDQLSADLHALYPGERAFTDATATAKVHAFVDGHLNEKQLRAELAKLGLRARGDRRIEGIERLPKPKKAPEPGPGEKATTARRG